MNNAVLVIAVVVLILLIAIITYFTVKTVKTKNRIKTIAETALKAVEEVIASKVLPATAATPVAETPLPALPERYSPPNVISNNGTAPDYRFETRQTRCQLYKPSYYIDMGGRRISLNNGEGLLTEVITKRPNVNYKDWTPVPSVPVDAPEGPLPMSYRNGNLYLDGLK